jgi:hypothetical protein
MDVTKLNTYAYTHDEITNMNALLEMAMFMEQDPARLDEAFNPASLAKAAGSLMKASGLHVKKGDGLMQMAMRSGKLMAQFIWYAIKASKGDKEAAEKVKEIANTKITKEQVIDFILKLDMATAHILTTPIHTIDAITGWHIWANVKSKASTGFDKAKVALQQLIDVAKGVEAKVATQLQGYVQSIAQMLGLEGAVKGT